MLKPTRPTTAPNNSSSAATANSYSSSSSSARRPQSSAIRKTTTTTTTSRPGTARTTSSSSKNQNYYSHHHHSPSPSTRQQQQRRTSPTGTTISSATSTARQQQGQQQQVMYTNNQKASSSLSAAVADEMNGESFTNPAALNSPALPFPFCLPESLDDRLFKAHKVYNSQYNVRHPRVIDGRWLSGRNASNNSNSNKSKVKNKNATKKKKGATASTSTSTAHQQHDEQQPHSNSTVLNFTSSSEEQENKNKNDNDDDDPDLEKRQQQQLEFEQQQQQKQQQEEYEHQREEEWHPPNSSRSPMMSPQRRAALDKLLNIEASNRREAAERLAAEVSERREARRAEEAKRDEEERLKLEIARREFEQQMAEEIAERTAQSRAERKRRQAEAAKRHMQSEIHRLMNAEAKGRHEIDSGEHHAWREFKKQQREESSKILSLEALRAAEMKLAYYNWEMEKDARFAEAVDELSIEEFKIRKEISAEERQTWSDLVTVKRFQMVQEAQVKETENFLNKEERRRNRILEQRDDQIQYVWTADDTDPDPEKPRPMFQSAFSAVSNNNDNDHRNKSQTDHNDADDEEEHISSYTIQQEKQFIEDVYDSWKNILIQARKEEEERARQRKEIEDEEEYARANGLAKLEAQIFTVIFIEYEEEQRHVNVVGEARVEFIRNIFSKFEEDMRIREIVSREFAERMKLFVAFEEETRKLGLNQVEDREIQRIEHQKTQEASVIELERLETARRCGLPKDSDRIFVTTNNMEKSGLLSLDFDFLKVGFLHFNLDITKMGKIDLKFDVTNSSSSPQNNRDSNQSSTSSSAALLGVNLNVQSKHSGIEQEAEQNFDQILLHQQRELESIMEYERSRKNFVEDEERQRHEDVEKVEHDERKMVYFQFKTDLEVIPEMKKNEDEKNITEAAPDTGNQEIGEAEAREHFKSEEETKITEKAPDYGDEELDEEAVLKRKRSEMKVVVSDDDTTKNEDDEEGLDEDEDEEPQPLELRAATGIPRKSLVQVSDSDEHSLTRQELDISEPIQSPTNVQNNNNALDISEAPVGDSKDLLAISARRDNNNELNVSDEGLSERSSVQLQPVQASLAASQNNNNNNNNKNIDDLGLTPEAQSLQPAEITEDDAQSFSLAGSASAAAKPTTATATTTAVMNKQQDDGELADDNDDDADPIKDILSSQEISQALPNTIDSPSSSTRKALDLGASPSSTNNMMSPGPSSVSRRDRVGKQRVDKGAVARTEALNRAFGGNFNEDECYEIYFSGAGSGHLRLTCGAQFNVAENEILTSKMFSGHESQIFSIKKRDDGFIYIFPAMAKGKLALGLESADSTVIRLQKYDPNSDLQCFEFFPNNEDGENNNNNNKDDDGTCNISHKLRLDHFLEESSLGDDFLNVGAGEEDDGRCLLLPADDASTYAKLNMITSSAASRLFNQAQYNESIAERKHAVETIIGDIQSSGCFSLQPLNRNDHLTPEQQKQLQEASEEKKRLTEELEKVSSHQEENGVGEDVTTSVEEQLQQQLTAINNKINNSLLPKFAGSGSPNYSVKLVIPEPILTPTPPPANSRTGAGGRRARTAAAASAPPLPPSQTLQFAERFIFTDAGDGFVHLSWWADSNLCLTAPLEKNSPFTLQDSGGTRDHPISVTRQKFEVSVVANGSGFLLQPLSHPGMYLHLGKDPTRNEDEDEEENEEDQQQNDQNNKNGRREISFFLVADSSLPGCELVVSPIETAVTQGQVQISSRMKRDIKAQERQSALHKLLKLTSSSTSSSSSSSTSSASSHREHLLQEIKLQTSCYELVPHVVASQYSEGVSEQYLRYSLLYSAEQNDGTAKSSSSSKILFSLESATSPSAPMKKTERFSFLPAGGDNSGYFCICPHSTLELKQNAGDGDEISVSIKCIAVEMKDDGTNVADWFLVDYKGNDTSASALWEASSFELSQVLVDENGEEIQEHRESDNNNNSGETTSFIFKSRRYPDFAIEPQLDDEEVMFVKLVKVGSGEDEEENADVSTFCFINVNRKNPQQQEETITKKTTTTTTKLVAVDDDDEIDDEDLEELTDEYEEDVGEEMDEEL